MKNFVLLFVTCLLLACSTSNDDSMPAEPIVQTDPQSTESHNKENLVFTITQNGGCMMAGPNCAMYRLHLKDGSFELLRNVENAEVESTGTLHRNLVKAWLSELNKIDDIDDFIASLGEGECRACFDGVDLEYLVLDDGVTILSLSSSEKKFDKSEKFFELSDRLYRAMSQEAHLEMNIRR